MEFLSFNLGNLLTAISFIVGGILFVHAIRKDVSSLQDRLNGLETEMKKMTEVLIAVARQDERITHLERSVERIREKS